MNQVACSKLRELLDGVNYASKYGKSYTANILKLKLTRITEFFGTLSHV